MVKKKQRGYEGRRERWRDSSWAWPYIFHGGGLGSIPRLYGLQVPVKRCPYSQYRTRTRPWVLLIMVHKQTNKNPKPEPKPAGMQRKEHWTSTTIESYLTLALTTLSNLGQINSPLSLNRKCKSYCIGPSVLFLSEILLLIWFPFYDKWINTTCLTGITVLYISN